MSTSLTKASPHSKQHVFPLGYSAHCAAVLHDSIGCQFDCAGIELSYSYVVKAVRQENAIFKVSNKSYDYILWKSLCY